MKHMIAIIAALQTTTCVLLANETLFSQVKNLLVQIEKSKSEQYQDVYSFATIRDWRQSQEFKQLGDAFSENWEELLKNIKTVASSDTQQLILLEAFDVVSQKDNLLCFNQILDLRLSNDISEEAFEYFFGYGNKVIGNETTLDDKDSNLIAFEMLRKLKLIFADEPELIKSLDTHISKIEKGEPLEKKQHVVRTTTKKVTSNVAEEETQNGVFPKSTKNKESGRVVEKEQDKEQRKTILLWFFVGIPFCLLAIFYFIRRR